MWGIRALVSANPHFTDLIIHLPALVSGPERFWVAPYDRQLEVSRFGSCAESLLYFFRYEGRKSLTCLWKSLADAPLDMFPRAFAPTYLVELTGWTDYERMTAGCLRNKDSKGANQYSNTPVIIVRHSYRFLGRQAIRFNVNQLY